MSKKLLEDLIALMYGANCCYPAVVDTEIDGLTIHSETNEWSYACRGYKYRHKIGTSNYSMRDVSFGVIGVYNRKNTGHLGAMIRDWQEIQDAKNGRFGD